MMDRNDRDERASTREAKPPLVTLERVHLGYGHKGILEDVSLRICRGDLVGLVGPNGSGKTTLLRAVIGTLAPRSGAVTWAAGRRARIGYVPQSESLDAVWPLRVLDLVLMGRCGLVGRFKPYGRDDKTAAMAALDRVGLAAMSLEAPSELSGGQVRRALIARALAGDPELLILDEPTTGMDLAGAASMLALIQSLHVRSSITMLLVSHDLGIVSAISERIALIHEGRIREGDHDSLLSPEVLGAVYGIPVEVARSGSARAIFPPIPREFAS